MYYDQSVALDGQTVENMHLSRLQPVNIKVIPPGGHVEFRCDISEPDVLIQRGIIMPKTEAPFSLEAFYLLRPVIQDFYQQMSDEEKKELEGLRDFELIQVLEQKYEEHLLDAHLTTLPTETQKKLSKLSAEDRYAELRKSKIINSEQAYQAEKDMGKKTAAYVLANLSPEQQNLFAPYPHDLARRSVFFIEENSDKFLSKETKKRETVEDLVIGTGSWGYTLYSGKKLYISDEKAYVVLLGIAGRQKQKGVVDWHVVKGSIRSFLREAGLSENGQYIERFIDSIQAMHGGTFTFAGKDNKQTKGRKKRLKDVVEGWHLVSNYSVDSTTGEFVVILDRAYIETFITQFHMYSRMDIRKFCKQRETAGAINRFFNSHMPDPDGCKRFNMLLVAQVTNLITPEDYPDKEVTGEWPNSRIKFAKKRLLDKALKSLIEDGTFGPKTGIITRKRGEDDLVMVEYSKPAPNKVMKTRTLELAR